MPHPSVALEIAATHVAAARWGRDIAHLTASAVERLPDGVIVPSTTQTNINDQEAVRAAIRRVVSEVPSQGQPVALMVPDPVIRVFILSFDNFPRRNEEALPMLRWRLKKSLPFDAEEAAISWMRQANREGKPEVVAAVARQKIIREYEALAEQEGIAVGVVQSSTLATLPLLDRELSTLLVRMSGKNLTTVIARGDTLCVYRSTEMDKGPEGVTSQSTLDEVFPAIAFYQDTWGGKIDCVKVTGFGAGEEALRQEVAREIGCPAEALSMTKDLPAEARSLVARRLEALVGWHLNLGA
jgi:type IV pilus assembly protein PilM